MRFAARIVAAVAVGTAGAKAVGFVSTETKTWNPRHALAVNTTNGPVTGHYAPNHTHVLEYLGIPYAAPPTGSLRFAAPEPWDQYGPYVAANFVSTTMNV